MTFQFDKDIDGRVYHWDSSICVRPPKLEMSGSFYFYLVFFILGSISFDNRKDSIRLVNKNHDTVFSFLGLDFNDRLYLLLDLQAFNSSFPLKQFLPIYFLPSVFNL